MAEKTDPGFTREDLGGVLGEDDDLASVVAAAIDEADEESEEKEPGDDVSQKGDSGTEAPGKEAQAGAEAGDDLDADPGAEEEPGEGGNAAEAGADAGAELEAPAAWAAEAKDLFKKQPAEVRKFMAERHREMEADYTRKSQAAAPLRKVVDAWTPYITERGVTPEIAFNALMRADYALTKGSAEEKLAVLRDIAKSYNVDLAPLQGPAKDPAAAGDGSGEDDTDFTAAAVQMALKPFQDRIGQLESTLQGQQAKDLQAQNEATTAQIEAFRLAAEADGKLKHPYFAEVAEDMINLVAQTKRAGGKPDLADIYARCVRANPATFTKVLEAEKKAAIAEDRKRRREAAERAKKSGTSINGGPSSRKEQPKPSIDDAVWAAMGGP